MQCSVVQCSSGQYSASQYSAVQHIVVHLSVVQCSAAHCSSVQCISVRCNAVHHPLFRAAFTLPALGPFTGCHTLYTCLDFSLAVHFLSRDTSLHLSPVTCYYLFNFHLSPVTCHLSPPLHLPVLHSSSLTPCTT